MGEPVGEAFPHTRQNASVVMQGWYHSPVQGSRFSLKFLRRCHTKLWSWTYAVGWARVEVPGERGGVIVVRRSAPAPTYAGGGNEDEDQHEPYPNHTRRQPPTSREHQGPPPSPLERPDY